MANDNPIYISKISVNDATYDIKDSESRTSLSNKVDKVEGKGLSTEDFTTALKTKLTNLTQGVGSSTAGKSGFVYDGQNYTGGTGAEQFNYYWNADTRGNKAIGDYSHAEGYETVALGSRSHVEGRESVAIGNDSHAEGVSCKAYGGSHAEGGYTTAGATNISGAHSEGEYTRAIGSVSHAEGSYTLASADYSHAEGRWTTAASQYQHVQGKYNVVDSNNTYAFIIGNGASDLSRSNALAVDWNGKIYVGNDSSGVDLRYVKDLFEEAVGIETKVVPYNMTEQRIQIQVKATGAVNLVSKTGVVITRTNDTITESDLTIESADSSSIYYYDALDIERSVIVRDSGTIIYFRPAITLLDGSIKYGDLEQTSFEDAWNQSVKPDENTIQNALKNALNGESKNLLVISPATSTSNNITFTVDEDGIVDVNGDGTTTEVTNNTQFTLLSISANADINYEGLCMVQSNETAHSENMWFRFGYVDGTQETIATASPTGIIIGQYDTTRPTRFYITVRTQRAYDHVKFYPMVCKQESAAVAPEFTSPTATFTAKEKTNLVSQVNTVDQLATQLQTNLSLLKATSKTIDLNTQTWTQSANGMYYTGSISVSGLVEVYSIVITGFSALKATDYIVPISNSSKNVIRLMASTSTFSNNANITVSVFGRYSS